MGVGEDIVSSLWFVLSILLLAYIGIHKGREIICKDKKSCEIPCKSMLVKDLVYMAAIFMILTVVILSLALYKDGMAIAYFSFASTLSSVILSVIAIIMTINSEQRSEAAKGQLEQAAQAMADMNVELGSKIGSIKGYSDSIEDNITAFDLKLEDILSAARKTQDMLGSEVSKLGLNPALSYTEESESIINNPMEVSGDE